MRNLYLHIDLDRLENEATPSFTAISMTLLNFVLHFMYFCGCNSMNFTIFKIDLNANYMLNPCHVKTSSIAVRKLCNSMQMAVILEFNDLVAS